MRNLILISILLLLASFGYGQADTIDKSLLDKYRSQTARTDPGEYAYMFDNLPDDYKSLCRIVKNNLIHPQEAVGLNLPESRMISDGAIQDVKEILKALNPSPLAREPVPDLIREDTGGYEKESRGDTEGYANLNSKKAPEDKLVLACFHHSILLASMLRHQGVPVRLRAGYSRFFEKQAGIKFGHIICDVWDEKENRWILIDADREIVDMDENDFEFAAEGYNKLRKGKPDPRRYITSVSTGFKGSVYLLLLDASFVLQDEKLYYNLPGFLLDDFNSPRKLDRDILEDLDELASDFKNLDSNIRNINRTFHSQREFKPSGLDYDGYYKMISKQ